MQKFVAEESFWELFPEASIGVVVARDMLPANAVSPEDAAAIAALLDSANEKAKRYLTNETISQNEAVAVWREAFRRFKTKKGARCTIENLLKRVLKGSPVGTISPLVDLTNAMALTYALPIGGEDIDRVVGDFRLGVVQGGDAFLPIGEDAGDPTLPGELCYFDDEGAICRCWNWRDGQRTALTDESRNATFIVECIEPERIDELERMIDDTMRLVKRYFAADIGVRAVVDRAHPEVVLTR